MLARRAESGCETGNEVDRDRPGRRIDRVVRADTPDEDASFRSERDRSADVHSDLTIADFRRIAGLLRSGAASDKGGPDGRTQNRIDVRCQMSDVRCQMSVES